jgi:hypothetical protein
VIDRERVERAQTLGHRLLFGDRVGLLVFLGSLCLFLALWRTAFLINDTYTIANGLAAVEHGDIALPSAEYGSLQSPGTNRHGGDAFARNYGVIVLSLPFLYALRGIEAVADLPIALVAVWSLLVYATVLVAGRQFGRERLARIGGGVVVAALFVGNVALAQPIDSPPYHQLALQLLHVTVAAFVGTLAYRFVAHTDGRRLGLVAAVAVVGGTPLAFWASVPKRHVVTAAVALALALGLVYSRDRERDWAFESRALCYVLLALLAWIHAPEALILFVPFVAVDLATADENDLRTLSTLGAVFAVALVPLLVTNTLISGDPLTVPRMLGGGDAGGGVDLSGGQSSDGGSGDGGGGSSLPGVLLLAIAAFQSALEPFSKLWGLADQGANRIAAEPGAAIQTFLRSGYVERIADRAEGTPEANLALLESAPALAAILGALPVGVSTLRRSFENRSVPRTITSGDVFLLATAILLSLVYSERLPIHAQVTVRYLFPVAPMLVCLIVRLPPIRRALLAHWRATLWSVAGGVLIGGQLVLVALVALDVGRGEAFQFHALLGLAVGAALGTWSLLAVATDRLDRLGAVLFGLAVASAAVFVGFAAIEYFGLGGTHALPMIRAVADAIPLR